MDNCEDNTRGHRNNRSWTWSGEVSDTLAAEGDTRTGAGTQQVSQTIVLTLKLMYLTGKILVLGPNTKIIQRIFFLHDNW